MSDSGLESEGRRLGRLHWYREQLAQSLAELSHAGNIRKALAQAFQRALYHGFEAEEIRAMILELAQADLPHREAILPALQDLTPGEVAIDAQPPELQIGQTVQVILSSRNHSSREGSIIDRIWHHKDRRWNYFMEENGKALSKRYFVGDFLPLVSEPVDLWLRITCIPGLSPIKRVCTVELTDGGLLTQSFFERRASGAGNLFSTHDCNLADSQLELLRASLAAIDFPRLAKRLRDATDAGTLSIEVYRQGVAMYAIKGGILHGDRGDHDFRGAFEPAQKFWKLLLDFVPEELR